MTDPVAQLSAALAGRYDLEREIGAGGMATVVLARLLKAIADAQSLVVVGWRAELKARLAGRSAR